MYHDLYKGISSHDSAMSFCQVMCITHEINVITNFVFVSTDI